MFAFDDHLRTCVCVCVPQIPLHLQLRPHLAPLKTSFEYGARTVVPWKNRVNWEGYFTKGGPRDRAKFGDWGKTSVYRFAGGNEIFKKDTGKWKKSLTIRLAPGYFYWSGGMR
jgi:hypothetical protein